MKVGIITVSDRAAAGEYEDQGGPALQTEAARRGWQVVADALVADDKVWLGTEDGELHILKAGKELKSLATIEFPAPIYSSAVVANGVVYVATQTHLYAIGK